MTNNTISVTVNQVNGNVGDILVNEKPKTAIDNYFYPDSGAPVSSLIIKAKTSDGKIVTLVLTQTNISATVEE
jgi:hypothetical protein